MPHCKIVWYTGITSWFWLIIPSAFVLSTNSFSETNRFLLLFNTGFIIYEIIFNLMLFFFIFLFYSDIKYYNFIFIFL